MLGEKRMFSRRVVESDAFLDMSAGAQMLYFHLCMNADDEGFIASPKRITRMVGAEQKDYKALVSNRFVLEFESGVIVIKHWWINNTARKDRCQPTGYTEERAKLFIKDNRAYTLNGNQASTTCQPYDNQASTQNKIKENKIKQNKRKESAEGETNAYKSMQMDANAPVPYDFSKILQNISRRVNDESDQQ